MDTDYIRVNEAAQLLGVRPSVVLERIDAGELEGLNRDGEIVVRRDVVESETVPGGS